VAISAKEILHFGKYGLRFLFFLFSDILSRERGRGCEDAACVRRTVAHMRERRSHV
jgi:hypothetical protein